jgi:hypothetical protein
MLVMLGGIALLLVVVVGTGVWVLAHQPTAANDVASSAISSPSPVASRSPSPSPSHVVVAPLTARLAGQYCPVAHLGDSACWKGTLVNTGPPIGNLAFIFIVGGPYSNWFANHSSPALSGFYTSAGCDIDAAHARLVCGPVATGQEVDVYLGGDVSRRGTFNYDVKFADISGAVPVYVNQHPDGTHDALGWREAIR